MSLREQILGIDDKKRVPVVIPEWNDITVYVTSMSAERQSAHIAARQKYPDVQGSLVLAVFTAEDETGNLIFTEDDIPALAKKNIAPLKRIWVIADDMIPSNEDVRKNSSAPPDSGTK